ncbi:imidazolonepropionase-like amidohydrolase [Herbihabitans rhizosphaerae]|uniref:Imidazolonepropionase-like amidohydrolase n=1 Tax=Herbihabitans rhizosphaerae TaxID=1872711 RepID=A0A4Q7KDP4_9PSEU|nr:amidohydrolase family protein [Herbihabitans rhizosphaerae]RZS31364.1 imidazolonepropionase-like amidohydrolase [Herbihabitans rhizosphaerae]
MARRVHRRPAILLGTVLAAGLIVATAEAPASPDTAQAPQATNTFLVRDVRIFDGVRATGVGSVLVVGGHIAAIGDLAAPRGVPIHDGRGKTLLPGLIDGHTHSFAFFGADPAVDGRDALRFGVTTQLDTWGDPARIPAARRQRQSWQRTDQADVWSSGDLVTVEKGLPADTVPNLPKIARLGPGDDPGRLVADRVAEGSDFIKFMLDDGKIFGLDFPTLSPAQLRAVVAAAHRRGRLAVGHVAALNLARIAVDAGADGLVHIFIDPTDDAFVRAARARGTFVTPTLSIVDCGRGSDDLLRDPRVHPYLSETQLRALRNRQPGCPPTLLQMAASNVLRLHSAGVPITAGTDAGGGGAFGFWAHGATLLAELTHLVGAGLTPAQALAAATAAPARIYDLADRGRIAPGLRADLLLVNGDPTEDVAAVRDVAMIWKNGYPVDRAPR